MFHKCIYTTHPELSGMYSVTTYIFVVLFLFIYKNEFFVVMEILRFAINCYLTMLFSKSSDNHLNATLFAFTSSGDFEGRYELLLIVDVCLFMYITYLKESFGVMQVHVLLNNCSFSAYQGTRMISTEKYLRI